MKNEFSKNTKLNNVLTDIKNQLLDFGIDEIKRYKKEFPYEKDYNIVQYGNLLVYYNDIYKMYRECGYKSTDKMSSDKIWEVYKNQVGYVAKYLLTNN